jgi:hypothetical protein
MVSDNIQETNTTLTNELINIADDYIPVKKFNNKNQKPCVPWWDQNCTKLGSLVKVVLVSCILSETMLQLNLISHALVNPFQSAFL